MKTKKEYRPDIDVLRAIAVLSVMFYHAHIPFFSGGFIGVSIFFVISGYLITGIIKQKVENGTFSFLEFYENRIRRILPALTIMMLVVIAIYYIFTSHLELLPLQRSVKRAIIGFANIHFYFNTNYFDQAAETMPLLHTWSLGVEEQFYFIMPALIFIFYSKFHNNIKIIHLLYGITLLSFIGSLYFVYYNQKFAFYMLPTRAWELLMGSILAYTAWSPKSARGKFFCTITGLILIGLSIIFYDNTFSFPGFWAIIPCLGACLYIAGGTNAPRSILHAITYNKALLFIGLISYSLYLWHWPIFVFYQTFPFYTPITVLDGVMLSLLSIFIAALSWKLIENPFRYHAVFKNRKIIWPLSIFCVGTMLYLGSALRYTNVSVNYQYTVPPLITEYNIQTDTNNLDFLLIGDSHAKGYSLLLQDLAIQYNLSGSYVPQIIKNCVSSKASQTDIDHVINEWNKLSKLYKTTSIDTLIIALRLTEKLSGKDVYYNKFSPEYPILSIKDKSLSPEEAFYQGLKETIAEAKENGMKNIYIQLPFPEPKAFIPQKASILHKFYNYDNDKINETLGENVKEYQTRTKIVMDILQTLKQDFPDIQFIDVASCFLHQGRYSTVSGNTSFYYDDDHPSAEGMQHCKKPIENIFAKIAKRKNSKNKNQ